MAHMCTEVEVGNFGKCIKWVTCFAPEKVYDVQKE